MPTLKLTLTATDNKRFTIFAENYGSETSELPFANNQENSHLYTVIDALKKLTNNYSSHPDDDQEWMISEGLLCEKDPNFFHPQMRENIGKKLYQALFKGNIEKALYQKLANNEDLHIQIEYDFRVSDNSTLSLYPWNLVHHGNEFLAKGRVTFSYRIAHLNSLPSGKRQIDKLKVLVISSQASENSESQLQNQELLINNSLKKAQDEGRACLLSWYKPGKKPTFKRLQDYLTDHSKQSDKLPDIIHFNGHGVFKKKCNNPMCPKRDTNEIFYNRKIEKCKFCESPLKDGTGFLLFENEEGQPDYISAEQFTNLIKNSQPKPQLIVITACQSALADQHDSVFNGVAQKLLQEVPAVVATPFTISQDSTTDFIDQFYRVLGNGQSSLLEAVKRASETMKYYEYEWYRFVVFLRYDGDKDGYLFDFQETQLQPVIPQNKELQVSDIETLKDLLRRSGNASMFGREDLCRSIEISTNFYPRNLMLEGDDIYINSLFTYLQDMKKLKSFYKLCEKIEHHFKDTPDETNLQIIKSKLLKFI